MRPGYVDPYQSITLALAAEGKFKAAKNYIKTALQLDPFSTLGHYNQGVIFYFEERFEEAIDCFKRSLSYETNFTFSYLLWGGSLIMLGRPADALSVFHQIPAAGEADLSRIGGQTLAYAAMGHIEMAITGIEQLKSKMESDIMGRALFFLILTYALLGKEELALEMVRHGIDRKVSTMIMIKQEPLLKALRPSSKFQELIKRVMGDETGFELRPKKYQSSSLTEAAREKYAALLNDHMIRQRPYLDPELSLSSLAGMIDMHPNHLSQVLNETLGQNFAEYVNTFRLEDFKKKAQDPANQHLTILALALDSGFNSKTVFNTFFKKKMGMTPSAYWKKIKE